MAKFICDGDFHIAVDDISVFYFRFGYIEVYRRGMTINEDGEGEQPHSIKCTIDQMRTAIAHPCIIYDVCEMKVII